MDRHLSAVAFDDFPPSMNERLDSPLKRTLRQPRPRRIRIEQGCQAWAEPRRATQEVSRQFFLALIRHHLLFKTVACA